MSIKETEVEITLGVRNIKHYENKGYKEEIDSLKYFNKNNNKMLVKRGTKIWVKVEDLLPDSTVKITAICENPNCPNPERILSFQQYTDICHYCSIHSEEHRLKLTGENNPKFGKTLEELYGEEKAKELKENMKKPKSEETKKKISISISGKIGQAAPNWNPNLTAEERAERKENRNNDPEFVKWSIKIKERDNFKCVIPGCNNHDLESHHLDNWNDFPDKRYDLDNGVTLCLEHHKSANGYSFHTIYGSKGNVQEQFIEWIDMFKEDDYIN